MIISGKFVVTLDTDGNLNIVQEGPELIFHISDGLLDTMDEWCTRTHGESGLTEKCRKSQLTIEQGDEIVSEFIQKHCPNMPLAGNSVHMDACFMRKEMPKSMKSLSYRIVDVSSIKELSKRWYPDLHKAQPSKISKVTKFCNFIQKFQRLFLGFSHGKI